MDARLLAALTDTQATYLRDRDARAAFTRLVAVACDVTGSELGFLGELDGGRLLSPTASRGGWDAPALLGASVDGELVLLHDTSGAQAKLPPGHAAVFAFAALPFRGGVLALGNRAGGYDRSVAAELAPLLDTCAVLVTAHAQELERRRAEERSRLLLSVATDGVWEWDLSSSRTIWSGRVYEIMRVDPGLPPWSFEQTIAATHPEDRDAFEQALTRHIANGEAYHLEVRIRRGDASWGAMRSTGRIFLDDHGQAVRGCGTVEDVTMRRQVDEQVNAAQRLEAIGRLAGGVAHDFNNLLTVIANCASLLADSLPPGMAHDDAVTILETTRRGGELTRQLLTFSRRSMQEARAAAINEVITGLRRMVLRILRDDVRLSFHLDGTCRAVRADASQLEQVVLNLVVNARDAIARGGKIIVQTTRTILGGDDARLAAAGVQPGPFICLSVRDDGAGMDEATRARLFEPFFTTKGHQSGGLGLSTVYGIVKQAGGFIAVETAPGAGSTFDVWLPEVPVLHVETAGSLPAPTMSGTVLLVEDQDLVRRTVRRILERAGFTVREAASPRDALAGDIDDVDLLVTDIVMPGMDGRQLADAVRARKPDMAVLFMSGYTEDAAVRQGLYGRRTRYLAKPFRPDTLLERVRDLLDE